MESRVRAAHPRKRWAIVTRALAGRRAPGARFILLLLLCWRAAFAIDAAPAFTDTTLQSRYEELTHQLRCLVCQNETIADSNATLAGDLRRQLREMIAAGKSDQEILKYMTDRYGDFVLYRPPFEMRTWLLWAAPVLLVLAGIATALVVVLRRARMTIDEDAADS